MPNVAMLLLPVARVHRAGRATTLFIGLLIAPTGSLTGQAGSVREPGTRVRLAVDTLVGSPSLVVVGEVVSVASGSVTIRQDRVGRPVVFQLQRIRRLEVSNGRRAQVGRGALIGFGAGAVAGAATVFIACLGGDCEGSSGDFTGFGVLVVGGLGAVVGAGVGAVTGAIVTRERWRPRPVGELRVNMGPTPGGGLSLSASLPVRLRWPSR